MGQRINFIDYAKAIGIFLVVLAHTPLKSEITDWIYVFHMPLFFFLSGYLFDIKRYPTFNGFMVRRFHQLVIPYFLINLFTYYLWLFVFRHYGADSEIAITWYHPMIGFLLGNGNEMIHNVPLWFLLCLFIVEIVFYLIIQHSSVDKIGYILGFLALVGYLNYHYNPILLPFSLGTAVVGIVFYGVGYLCNQYQLLKNHFLGFIISFVITILVASYNGRIYMHINYYNHYLLFFVGALSGIYMMMCLCVYLTKMVKSTFINYIGRNTLLICGFHLMVFSLIKGILLFGFHFNLQSLEQAIIGNVLFAVVAILLCCLLISTYHKGKVLIDHVRNK